MLKTLRRILAVVFFIGITLLFLDFTGTVHAWLGWMARVQFIPAVLSSSVVIIAAIVIITLLFGRIYCSVVCPLGVMQDGFAAIGKRVKRNRYRYSPAVKWLRLLMLGVFIGAVASGISLIFAILAPYSAYGRIVNSIFNPAVIFINNYLSSRGALAAAYPHDVWWKSITVIAVSAGTLIVVGTLAYRNGRTWCNTVCPVGTVLGVISRFSLMRVKIDESKCINCGLCARNCKSACIDFKNHSIDYSRCVDCMDCLDKCTTGAITYGKYRSHKGTVTPEKPADAGRRVFLTATGVIGATVVAEAQKKVDGGLAVIENKQIPKRGCPIVPPGAESLRHMSRHCTACQLCVTVCPNNVLRPSSSPSRLMQPESSYERGYCRPECTRCSHVCPTGAIRPITPEEKTNISIGHAVWIRDNCIPVTKGHNCNCCERHCPTGAITRVPLDPSDPNSVLIPVVDTAKCIGCGACENLCPARPLAAMYVEGNSRHIIL